MKHIVGHLGLLTFCALLMVLTVLLASCGNDNIIRVFDDTGSIADSEPDSETLPPENAVAGFLKYSLTQVACPGCFNETDELDVRMESLFHLPISSSWFTGIPDRGTCVTNLMEITPSVNQVSVGTHIDFVGGWSDGYMYEQGIVSNSQYHYTTGYMAEANYNRDTSHDLYISDYDIFIEDAFTSIHGFDYIEPYELLWVDPSYAFAVTLFRSGMSFSWGPSGSDDDFLVMVASYDPSTGAYLGNIACMGADTGNMFIPAEYASELPSGALASVHFQRHRRNRFAFNRFPAHEFPVWVETHMLWEVVGTGHIE